MKARMSVRAWLEETGCKGSQPGCLLVVMVKGLRFVLTLGAASYKKLFLNFTRNEKNDGVMRSPWLLWCDEVTMVTVVAGLLRQLTEPE